MTTDQHTSPAMARALAATAALDDYEITRTEKWMRPNDAWELVPVWRFTYPDGRTADAMMLTEHQLDKFQQQEAERCARNLEAVDRACAAMAEPLSQKVA